MDPNAPPYRPSGTHSRPSAPYGAQINTPSPAINPYSAGGKVRCGNCDSRGHEVKDCVGPVDKFGFIVACPFCNTKQHVISTCPKSDSINSGQLIHFILVSRQNKPPVCWDQDYRESALWSSYTKKEYPPWTAEFAEQYQRKNPGWYYNFEYGSWELELARLPQDPAWEQPNNVPRGSQCHPCPPPAPAPSSPALAPSAPAPITIFATLASGSGGHDESLLVLERLIKHEREFYRGRSPTFASNQKSKTRASSRSASLEEPSKDNIRRERSPIRSVEDLKARIKAPSIPLGRRFGKSSTGSAAAAAAAAAAPGDAPEPMEVDLLSAEIQKGPTGETPRCENCGTNGHDESTCSQPCGHCGHPTHKHTASQCRKPVQQHCLCAEFPQHLIFHCKEPCRSCRTGERHSAMDCEKRCCMCGKLNHHNGRKCKWRSCKVCLPDTELHLSQQHIEENLGCKFPSCGVYKCDKHYQKCGMSAHDSHDKTNKSACPNKYVNKIGKDHFFRYPNPDHQAFKFGGLQGKGCSQCRQPAVEAPAKTANEDDGKVGRRGVDEMDVDDGEREWKAVGKGGSKGQ